ncbi:hypothetical protein M2271_000157 [Streptomyces sp. LBL]|uniref:hypothetical protein n=1 Tax=Streptomyces sp. LBL TaxID=2940562 RepID=UPI002474AEB9|nr:hypothetical protein [Streptomyces sp. LBL]MDH6622370.1 hypothetical protein [Streptomyces sp. LBL]
MYRSSADRRSPRARTRPRAERDEPAVAERVLERMSEQLAEELGLDTGVRGRLEPL